MKQFFWHQRIRKRKVSPSCHGWTSCESACSRSNEQQTAEFITTVNIGSCSLHIFTWCLSNWNDFNWMESGWTMMSMMLFHTNSEPLMDRGWYCGWPSSSAICGFNSKALDESLSNKTSQKHKSFDILVDNHLNVLIPEKLEFFSFLERILKPYLVTTLTSVTNWARWWMRSL